MTAAPVNESRTCVKEFSFSCYSRHHLDLRSCYCLNLYAARELNLIAFILRQLYIVLNTSLHVITVILL